MFISLIKGHAQDFTTNTATFTDKFSQMGDIKKQQKEDELKSHEQETELLKLKQEQDKEKLSKIVNIKRHIIPDNILTYKNLKAIKPEPFKICISKRTPF